MSRDPAADLRRIAWCLERALEPSYRVKAFRTAAAVVDGLPADELARRALDGSLQELTGIGKVTALVVEQSLAGEEPIYLRRVETLGDTPVSEGAALLRAALRGDCHVHSGLVGRRLTDRRDGICSTGSGSRLDGADRPLAAADGRPRADGRAASPSSSTSWRS